MTMRLFFSRSMLYVAIVLLVSLVNISRSDGETLAKNDSQATSLLQTIKGTTPEDQFFLGMFTLHFNAKSRRIRNWHTNLIGLEYKGLFFGTFENSFYNQCWTVGFGRDVYSTHLSDSWQLKTGYRLGAIYGYKDGEAPFAGVSPVVPLVALYAQSIFHEHFGVEVTLTTSISLGFFYQF